MSTPIRGTKFTAAKRTAYLDALRGGSRRGAAARGVGVTPHCARQHYMADPAWAAEVEAAELEAHEQVEDALFQAATSGNVVAIQVWLYNRLPDQWADKRNLQVNVGIQAEAERVAAVTGVPVAALLVEYERVVGALPDGRRG